MQIDLSGYNSRIQTAQEAVTAAQKALETAQHRLSEELQAVQTEIKLKIEVGDSSGSLLQDQLLVVFGLQLAYIENVLIFSRTLKESAGKVLIIGFEYQRPTKHVMFPHSGNDNEFAREMTFFAGILNGEEIQLKKSEFPIRPKVIIPFANYCTWGTYQSEAEFMQVLNGPVTLPDSMQVDGSSLLDMAQSYSGVLRKDEIPQCEKDGTMVIGPFMDPLPQAMEMGFMLRYFTGDIGKILKVLRAPSPAEKALGEGI